MLTHIQVGGYITASDLTQMSTWITEELTRRAISGAQSTSFTGAVTAVAVNKPIYNYNLIQAGATSVVAGNSITKGGLQAVVNLTRARKMEPWNIA